MQKCTNITVILFQALFGLEEPQLYTFIGGSYKLQKFGQFVSLGLFLAHFYA